MVKFGSEPFLECSSKGDKRFSAFYARIKSRDNKSIEDIYQSSKIFEDGSTGLSWKEAKGRKCVNQTEVRNLYRRLWIEYLDENPDLVEFLKRFNGYSDIFGQDGHACQAEEIYDYMAMRS
ncbi:hypothetical protein EVB94_187 [Rhizobium phage RHph_TM40]|uniref:Uncharacterized protein n=2 Tax=Cuauhnahuacvirus TaxID=3044696 RepID=A0A7S5R7W2_9CAUD|nr:hypothetical protein PQC16_gp188 [Rhizobium phage RHph_TM30]YP_010671338.1 hypothetical protein PQC17_gp189 [Rhizobium phage RHph_Y65]QIG71658.1 hypothetical protein EVB94_187 [Rhizobium phage RHph_TM40]QIG77774.1 hypothetical protein EVB64_187 [Rhizobium phage RHph_TM61]QIG71295.1 hypothetical protein EVB93_188 [Rhizobium phage RHph_TM30]QIG72747.1 hypothetical protein EVB97_189 [Rhizobium phage RHph_Y65]